MASSTLDIAAQVIKIEPGGKYVLLFQQMLTNDQAARIKHELEDFMTNDQTFVVIAGGGVSLVRVDETNDASDAKACGG